MMDLKEYVRFYGHRGLKTHLSAHSRVKGGDHAVASSLRRQGTVFGVDWEEKATDFFYVPGAAQLNDSFQDNIDSFKLYVDLVKPTAKLEMMRVSSFSSERHQEEILWLCPFVPRYRVAEFEVASAKGVPIKTTEKSKSGKRVFSKNRSAFRAWIEDDEEILEECTRLDWQWWKIPRLCKDQADLKRCEELVRQHYSELKHIFTALISNVEFPNIGWLAFAQYVEKIHLIDRSCTMSVVDSVFIATNYEVEDMDENPDRALNRHEFIEFLVRIAAVKYKDTKQASTFAEAFEMLLKKNVLEYSHPPPWQEFREKELWDLAPDDVITANLAHLNKVHDKLTKVKGKHATLAVRAVIDLVTKDSRLMLSEKDAFFCFGMSKMTVKDENDGGTLRYNVLTRAEFYEFIGRVAALKYHDRTDQALATKMEYVLDAILPKFGLARVPVDWEAIEEVDDVSSDDSVDLHNVESNYGLFQE